MELDPNSIEYLILEGAAEVAGMDMETSEVKYRFTPKLKEVNPQLHMAMTNHLYTSILSLWEKGVLDVDMISDDPSVSPTKLAFDKTFIDSELSDLEKNVLDNVLRYANGKV